MAPAAKGREPSPRMRPPCAREDRTVFRRALDMAAGTRRFACGEALAARTLLAKQVPKQVRGTAMRSNSIQVEPVGSAVGAEIRGIDLSAPLGDGEVALIRETLFDRGVVFFRDQSLTPEQHIAFAERFAPDQRQPLLPRRRGLSGDRRGAEGTRPDQEYRRRLAHRPQLRPGPGAGLGTAGARVAAARRGHAVRLHVRGLRRAVGRAEVDAGGAARGAFQPARLRPQGADRGACGWPLPQCRPGGAGRGPPGGDPPSRQRPARAVCEPRLHPALRRLDRRGEPRAARLPLSPRASGRSSNAASNGGRARSPSGTTAPPGTMRRTTTRASGG